MSPFFQKSINIDREIEIFAQDSKSETIARGWNYSVTMQKFHDITIMIETTVKYFGHRAVSSQQQITRQATI
jgi:hypothetical protein